MTINVYAPSGSTRDELNEVTGEELEPPEDGLEFVRSLEPAAGYSITRPENAGEDGRWALWRHESDANQTDTGAHYEEIAGKGNVVRARRRERSCESEIAGHGSCRIHRPSCR